MPKILLLTCAVAFIAIFAPTSNEEGRIALAFISGGALVAAAFTDAANKALRHDKGKIIPFRPRPSRHDEGDAA